ncbi:hypothetical protein B9Z55_026048 [Caenorhabditis nigoni]|uniref:Uncharacterized protein n=1 Tax=Caenorhabditis nigoni TaxID=1611254 RepID=A0A2G5T1C1_9PELO|nr:hypothetical protein B9Z55_026048 [Caenorhabditis nigoni]
MRAVDWTKKKSFRLPIHFLMLQNYIDEIKDWWRFHVDVGFLPFLRQFFKNLKTTVVFEKRRCNDLHDRND